MAPEEIRVEIFKRRKEISLNKIAKSLNPPVSREMVYYVINRKSVSERVARAVAQAIGEPFLRVFPEYFQKEKGKSRRS